MRTKTTILSAVALAAGLLSAGAQIYSANVVGYYNVTVPANGYGMFANQITNTGAGGNSVQNILTSGFVSDPNGIVNTVLYYWNGGGYNQYQYFTDADQQAYFLNAPGTAGWYDGVGNYVSVQMKQGAGHFIRNLTGTQLTNTIVGQVPQGAFSIPVPTGFNTYSICPPVGTNFVNFAAFPGTSDVNGTVNDVYYKWNGAGFNQYQYFTDADQQAYFLNAPGTAGWYDGVGNNVTLTTQPKVGEGFFIRHFAAPTTWNYSFTVQ